MWTKETKQDQVMGVWDVSVPDTQSLAPMAARPPAPAPAERDVFKPSMRTLLIFGTLCVLSFMVALDGTSISVAIPIIATELDGSAIEAFWSGTSFLLCSTVFQPGFASLSDIFGRKPLILISLALFFIGTLVCGLCKDFGQMLVGRSIQGVGGGGLITLTEVIVTDLIPMRERGKYFGGFSAVWSLGSVLGPILGGGFSQDVSWRWIFYINFPFIAIGAVFVFVFLKLNKLPAALAAKLRRIDYIGSVLFIGSITSFLIPVTWGGVMYDWDSWRTLVPLIVGTLGLVATTMYEAYIATEPMIPITVFATRTAIVTYIETVCHGLVLWCTLYFLPLYFETVQEYSPIVSGVALFPLSFTVAPSAAVTGILVTLTGHFRWATWLGFLLSTLGLGLFCLIGPTTSIPAWIFLILPAGIGLGILFPALGYAIQASALPGHMSMSVAMFSFFRAFGQALGVAVGGVIFQNRMYVNLLAYPAHAARAADMSKDAAGLVQIVRAMAEGEEKMQLKMAYTDSLKIVWAVCCGMVGVAGLLSLLTESFDLNQEVESEQMVREEKEEEEKAGENPFASPEDGEVSRRGSRRSEEGVDLDAVRTRMEFI